MPKEIIPLEYMSQAEATVEGEEALAIFYGLLYGVNEKEWVYYHSLAHTKTDVYGLAQTYTNNHSTLEVDGEVLYTTNPIHVIRRPVTEKINGEVVTCTLEGLLYSNGAVFILRRPDFNLTMLWIDTNTAKSFNYPKPS